MLRTPKQKKKNATDDSAVVPETAIFTCVFNALGFLPGIMASMLVGGGSFGKGRQPVPAPPFVFGAFALGFFSLGPYLAVRNYFPQAARDEGEETSTLEVMCFVCVSVCLYC